MELNRFTQEAIQSSSTFAARYHNQQIDCEHLFLALLEQSDGLASGLFQMMDIPPPFTHTMLSEVQTRVRTVFICADEMQIPHVSLQGWD